jgi:glutathione S-transferase
LIGGIRKTPKKMSNVKLYSCLICPFAQRSWLYAVHYKIDFEYVEFDLYDENFKKIIKKPDWYMELNPRGQVPTLTDGDFAVWESGVVNEYIETVLNKDESLILTPKDGQQRF